MGWGWGWEEEDKVDDTFLLSPLYVCFLKVGE